MAVSLDHHVDLIRFEKVTGGESRICFKFPLSQNAVTIVRIESEVNNDRSPFLFQLKRIRFQGDLGLCGVR